VFVRVVYIQPPHGPTLLAPKSSPRAAGSSTVPSDDESLIAYVKVLKCKRAALASQMALLQGNVLSQASHAANVEQSSHSTQIQPMHRSALTRDTSMLPLKVVPPIVPSPTIMKGKSKIPSQFSLGNVASFVANLRRKAVATHSTCVTSPS
jgi:hypothetical protein